MDFVKKILVFSPVINVILFYCYFSHLLFLLSEINSIPSYLVASFLYEIYFYLVSKWCKKIQFIFECFKFDALDQFKGKEVAKLFFSKGVKNEPFKIMHHNTCVHYLVTLVCIFYFCLFFQQICKKCF